MNKTEIGLFRLFIKHNKEWSCDFDIYSKKTQTNNYIQEKYKTFYKYNKHAAFNKYVLQTVQFNFNK